MPDLMIVEGDSENPPTTECGGEMGPGMGFLQSVVIDQHFAQRADGLGRLILALYSSQLT
jgi:cyanophycinase